MFKPSTTSIFGGFSCQPPTTWSSYAGYAFCEVLLRCFCFPGPSHAPRDMQRYVNISEGLRNRWLVTRLDGPMLSSTFGDFWDLVAVKFHPYQEVKSVKSRNLFVKQTVKVWIIFRILGPFQKDKRILVHNFIGTHIFENNIWLKAEMMRGIELMLQLQGELGCRNSSLEVWMVGSWVQFPE